MVSKIENTHKKIGLVALAILLFFLGINLVQKINIMNRKYTLEQYNSIYNGMPKDDMVGIVGYGEEIANSTIGDITTQEYSYRNNDGSNMAITVQNFKVVSKAQYGLKYSGKKIVVKSKENNNISSQKDDQATNVKKLPVEKTIEGITVKLNKVVQDADSLKVYITYSNKTNDVIDPGDSSMKIIYNNTEYKYDSNFNIERTYNNPSLPPVIGTIKPNQSLDYIIFFKPISNVDTVNIELYVDLTDNFKFENVKVSK